MTTQPENLKAVRKAVDSVLFLDIDGVCNSAKTINRSHRGVIGIDPYMAFLVGKIVLDTGCNVVLSSSWRHSPDGRDEVRKAVVNFVDITPTLPRPSGTSVEYAERGKEILAWLAEHPEVKKYAILDDDSDFLPDQPLFKTSWQEGLTEEIAAAVIKYLKAEPLLVARDEQEKG